MHYDMTQIQEHEFVKCCNFKLHSSLLLERLTVLQSSVGAFSKISENMCFMKEELHRYRRLLDHFPKITKNASFKQEEQDTERMLNSETDDMSDDETTDSQSLMVEREGNAEHIVKLDDSHTSKTSHSYRLMRLKTENENLQILQIIKDFKFSFSVLRRMRR